MSAYNGNNYFKVKKVLFNNVLYDSKLEIKCFQQLKTYELAGVIKDIKYHIVCPFIIKDVQVCTYELDFSYIIVQSGTRVACEVKGYWKEPAIIKWKIFKALYKDQYDKFEVWPECTKVKEVKIKGKK